MTVLTWAHAVTLQSGPTVKAARSGTIHSGMWHSQLVLDEGAAAVVVLGADILGRGAAEGAQRHQANLSGTA